MKVRGLVLSIGVGKARTSITQAINFDENITDNKF